MSEKLNNIAKAAQETYQAIEDGVVGAYKKVEEGAVSAYEKVEDFFVDKMFRREDETLEETKDRMKNHQ